MNVKIQPFTAFGEIKAPPSKSFAHRLLIGASLKKGKTLIKNVGNSADVIATINCLNALGAQISIVDGNAEVKGIDKLKKGQTLNCNESGSTLRFLMPISCALGADSVFCGSQKLLSRPSELLIDELERHGVFCSNYKFTGKLKSGKYFIDGSVSSQFVTGLLFALPLLDGESELTIVGDLVSLDYVNITLEVLTECGIVYKKSGNKFVICGNQEYKLPNEVCVEGDWSGSACALVLGATCGQVTLSGLNLNSAQGDKRILEVIKKAGGEISVLDDKVTVKKDKLQAFEYNFENAPDIAPVCAGLASVCDGQSVLSGISRLKIKESDRIFSILQVLESAKIKAKHEDNAIKIVGSKVNSAKFTCQNDHRIVMLATILCALANGESEIVDAQAINKSYTAFFEDIDKLGGKVDVCI